MKPDTTPRPASGKLYLVPTPLGENTLHTLPAYLVEVVRRLDTFIVERAKTARHFLKAIGTAIPLAAIEMLELNEHTRPEELEALLAALLAGKTVGLLSEAGCPGVADPGAAVVALAHQAGIEVVPFVGPSSILLGLMASGFNGQQFTFLGYLPAKTAERLKAIRALELQMQRTQQTQIFIETPYRNGALLDDLLKQLSPFTRLCIGMNLTTETEQIRTKTVEQWRKTRDLDAWRQKVPTIFLVGHS